MQTERTAREPRTPSAEARVVWALGYLGGRARVYLRGNVPLNAVAAGVEIALRDRASLDALNRVLTEAGLLWDEITGTLRASADFPQALPSKRPRLVGI